ncbi:hypothetical protein CHX26_12450 [Porphyrobacter sp. HT-58-2]|uniref:hypothetical protein n=1 Tax=Porphyrobacter sp. HT-58-2 TaxID=2023229 RepID=UPI000CDC1683|nr:hypothetical protein [Porphyrobacter sp. HT-58-2]AUX70191.1 hypothetical protein CHX26_12450 [Porphyrobacter sp. HT-58-2]
MSGRLILAVLAAALVPGMAVAQGTRPGEAVGASAAQKRWYESRIASLERSTGLQAATIAGIAQRLDLAYPGLSEARLLAELDALVERAVLLDVRLAAMQKDIDQLQNRLRNGARGVLVLADNGIGEGELARSQALLRDARRAFDEGDFARAEAIFGSLADTLAALSGEDLALLFDVERARALSAELLGTRADRERASGTRLDAIARRRQRQEQAALEIWQLGVDQVEADLDTYALFGDVTALDRADIVVEEDVLGIVDRAGRPREWGLGKALAARLAVQRAEFTDGATASGHFNRAFDLYAAALDAIDRAQHPLDYAEVQAGAARMLVMLAGRKDDPEAARELLEAAVQYLAGARQMYDDAGQMREAGQVLGDAAVALHTLARIVPPSQRGEALDGALTLGRMALDRLEMGEPDQGLAMIRLNLCSAMQDRAGIDRGDPERAEQSLTLFGEARGHCRAALDYLTADSHPSLHAFGRLVLASLGAAEAAMAPTERHSALLEEAKTDARAALDYFAGRDNLRQQAAVAQQVLDTIAVLER